MNLRVSKNAGNFLTSWGPIRFARGAVLHSFAVFLGICANGIELPVSRPGCFIPENRSPRACCKGVGGPHTSLDALTRENSVRCAGNGAAGRRPCSPCCSHCPDGGTPAWDVLGNANTRTAFHYRLVSCVLVES